MLDSDKPLTILSIMFSVSVICGAGDRGEASDRGDRHKRSLDRSQRTARRGHRLKVTFLRMSSSLEPSDAYSLKAACLSS